jgi:hypothetical protein
MWFLSMVSWSRVLSREGAGGDEPKEMRMVWAERWLATAMRGREGASWRGKSTSALGVYKSGSKVGNVEVCQGE